LLGRIFKEWFWVVLIQLIQHHNSQQQACGLVQVLQKYHRWAFDSKMFERQLHAPCELRSE